MSSIERLIIQNIERSKVRESLYPTYPTAESDFVNTDIDRQTADLIELYNLMLDKGYNKLPEGTAEKRSFREIENKLIELNVTGVKKSPIINNPGMPGEFLSSQEKTMLPENKRRRIKEASTSKYDKVYYDPEYDRDITIEQIRKQYDYFKKSPWFKKSFDEFLADNFEKKGKGNSPWTH